ncbi:MAG: methyl-accepting chemotaxis protein [Sedimenticola sp.]
MTDQTHGRMMRSLKVKLNLSFVVIVTLVLTLSGGYGYFRQQEQLTLWHQRQLDTALDRMETSLPEPLWNYDERVVRQIAQSELGGSGIGAIRVIGVDDTQIAGFDKSDGQQIAELTAPPVDKSERIFRKLHYGEGESRKVIGLVELYPDHTEVDQTLRELIVFYLLEILLLDLVTLVALSWLLSRFVLAPIRKVTEGIRNVAEGEGDLTQRIGGESQDELGELSNWFDAVMEKLQKAIFDISENAGRLTETAKQTSVLIANTSDGVEGQKEKSDMVATAVNQVSVTVKEIAKNAAEASGAANEAKDNVESGLQIVNQTITSINNLSNEIDETSRIIQRVAEESNNITSILSSIRAIADQTNLLALNAAIESARAGDMGRGFAVVADEVRTLAQRTQQSTEEIQSMIESLQAGIGEAVEGTAKGRSLTDQVVGQANEAGDALQDIDGSVGMITSLAAQIATATEEQSAMTSEVAENVTDMRNIAESTALGITKSHLGKDELYILAKNLESVVKKFCT